MSIRHVRWALELEDTRLRPTDKLTLITIAHHLDARAPERGTWVGLETIAARVGVALRNARTAVRRLTTFGLIERELRPGRSSIYRLPEVGEHFAENATPDAHIPPPRMDTSGVHPEPRMPASSPPRMSASGDTPEPRMPASGGGGCTHPGGRMHASPDPSSIHHRSIIPPPIPPASSSRSEAPPVGHTVDGGGGEDLSLGESFSESGARLLRFWSERIEPIDPRVLRLTTVSNAQVRMFRDCLRRVPDLEERLPDGLDPVAEWVSVTITPELLLKSPTALDKALGGIYREKNRDRIEAVRLARKAATRARELEERRKSPRPRLSDERVLAEDVPA